MDNVVNEAFLAQRRKWAQWGSYIGFGALIVGLMLTSRYPLWAYLCLLIGLIGASFGSYMASRYVQQPRADQVLAKAMESLDKRYVLYNYYLPSNHVVASHFGLTVLLTRPQAGVVSYENGHWRHKAGWRKVLQIFGEPNIGKPVQELEREKEWVKEWVEQVFAEEQIPVTGAIVFTNPKVELHAEGSPVPALVADDLPRFLKEELKGGQTLSTALQKELRRVLDQVVAETNAPKKK
ncbi:MAG: hypothetical protein H5T69_06915 [Chloroflexi bacterium]|nr:hypothetical protein [Chloroflexota bacterium]